MTLNDFMFVFGLLIVFMFILFAGIIVVTGRNEEARTAQRHKASHRKPKPHKHVLRSA